MSLFRPIISLRTDEQARISRIDDGIGILISNISLNYAQLYLVDSNLHNLLLHILTPIFLDRGILTIILPTD